jgi:ribosomal-protein-alanine N-acetyltransferase
MTSRERAGVTARPMRRGDVRAVNQIEVDRHRVDAWPSTAFHEALDLPERYVCLVAVESPDGIDPSGEIVAYGVVSLSGDVADLDNLTVRRDRERQGIGRWLLGLLLEAAAAKDAREVLLEVRHDNDPAIALYTGDGFVEVNRRRSYYAPGLDAIVMRRDLKSVAPMPTEAARG